jgi:hypothetical protein
MEITTALIEDLMMGTRRCPKSIYRGHQSQRIVWVVGSPRLFNLELGQRVE